MMYWKIKPSLNNEYKRPRSGSCSLTLTGDQLFKLWEEKNSNIKLAYGKDLLFAIA